MNIGGADVQVKGSASLHSNTQSAQGIQQKHPHSSAAAQKKHPQSGKLKSANGAKPLSQPGSNKSVAANKSEPEMKQLEPADKAQPLSNPKNNQSAGANKTNPDLNDGNSNPEPKKINTNVNVSSKSCGMNLQKYRQAVISISDKTSDNAKLTMAKQIADNYCLTASQIKVIMEQFSSDNTKVDFAKFAYLKCDNRNEYYKVNDAFNSEGSINELDKYIQTKKF